MPTWAKVVLIIVAICVLGFAAIGFFAYRWVSSNKSKFVATIEAGKSFGKGTNVEGCVDESLRRLGTGGMTGAINTRLFASGCLKAARPSPEFCEGVPLQKELMAAAEWSANTCRRRGSVDQQACLQVMQEVVRQCDESRRGGSVKTETSK